MIGTTPSHSDAVPDLTPGITLLRGHDRRASALHRIVLAELVDREGLVYWIDARNNASTYRLGELVPDQRFLTDVRIARAFTGYQHHALVRTLAGKVSPRTAFIVAPMIADLYRDDDIPRTEATEYLEAALGILEEIGDVCDIPILTTTRGEDDVSTLVADYATREIEYERTEFGYRYQGPDFETLLYRQEHYWQTTIPYWVDLFGAVEEDAAAHAYELGLVDATI